MPIRLICNGGRWGGEMMADWLPEGHAKLISALSRIYRYSQIFTNRGLKTVSVYAESANRTPV